jgi:hypothetical protein
LRNARLSAWRVPVELDVDRYVAGFPSGLIAPTKGNAMSDDDLKAELESLRRENAALKKGASDGIRMKVNTEQSPINRPSWMRPR